MTKIPDFTDTELRVIRTTLKERFGHEPELSRRCGVTHPGTRAASAMTASNIHI